MERYKKEMKEYTKNLVSNEIKNHGSQFNQLNL